jgi:hypothetical protein
VRPLNFASQPFRNETLPAVLFAAASVILFAVTVRHAFVLRGLRPAQTSKLHREVSALETELERLRAEGRSLTATKPPDKQVIAEWNVLKDLVDRRTFSWTGLFARLERVLPRDVRLVSIAPNVEHGEVLLEISAVARPPQAGLGLVGLLEARSEFEDVYPVSVADQEGGTAEFRYTMRYLPGAAEEPVAVPAAEEREEMTEEAPEEAQPASTASPAPTASPALQSPAPVVARPGPVDTRTRVPQRPRGARSPAPSEDGSPEEPEEAPN